MATSEQLLQLLGNEDIQARALISPYVNSTYLKSRTAG